VGLLVGFLDKGSVYSQTESPLLGVRVYIEGSDEFKGGGRTKTGLLELWMADGVLLGRYRAGLPDSEGIKKIDLRLRQADEMTRDHQQSFELESFAASVKGRIALETSGVTGGELTLLRNVSANSGITRGREMLHRR
jgi:hypothetical protein